MGLLSILGLGKQAGDAIASPIEAVGNVIDKLFTSDEERLDKGALLTRLAQKPGELQVEINKLEAQHRSTWVAGARPYIMWVCGTALAYQYIVRDLVAWGFRMWAPDTEQPPALAMEHLTTVLMGILGLGVLRTVEKIEKVTK